MPTLKKQPGALSEGQARSVQTVVQRGLSASGSDTDVDTVRDVTYLVQADRERAEDLERREKVYFGRERVEDPSREEHDGTITPTKRSSFEASETTTASGLLSVFGSYHVDQDWEDGASTPRPPADPFTDEPSAEGKDSPPVNTHAADALEKVEPLSTSAPLSIQRDTTDADPSHDVSITFASLAPTDTDKMKDGAIATMLESSYPPPRQAHQPNNPAPLKASLLQKIKDALGKNHFQQSQETDRQMLVTTIPLPPPPPSLPPYETSVVPPRPKAKPPPKPPATSLSKTQRAQLRAKAKAKKPSPPAAPTGSTVLAPPRFASVSQSEDSPSFLERVAELSTAKHLQEGPQGYLADHEGRKLPRH
jgi:hypothetical protein